MNIRINEIIRILIENKDKFITLKYISSILNVSEKTISRDLKLLENSEYFFVG